MIFFTSDTHFNHANILKHCNRPFKSVFDMNYSIIENWNNTVTDGDEVYILGDFCWKNNPDVFLSKLNGKKHLIHGNHDHKKTRNSKLWKSSQPYLELKYDNNLFVLFHYPIQIWNKKHFGSYHLHGHVHGALVGKEKENAYDVGVDCNNFMPISLSNIINKLSK